MKCETYIVAHKRPEGLPDMEGYRLIQVNAAKNGHWPGCFHDDFGDNISNKNNSYCELTALYSLWKNSDAEIKGLVHYRRFLGCKLNEGIQDQYIYQDITYQELKKNILDAQTIERDLEICDVILPSKVSTFPLNCLEDLERNCYPKDIKVLAKVIHETCPEYEENYVQTLHSSINFYCNIFIAKKDVFNSYCSWLFDLLARVEDRIDISSYDMHHKRIFGYLSEILLNVYVNKNLLKARYYDIIRVDSPRNKAKYNARKIVAAVGKFGPFAKALSNTEAIALLLGPIREKDAIEQQLLLPETADLTGYENLLKRNYCNDIKVVTPSEFKNYGIECFIASLPVKDSRLYAMFLIAGKDTDYSTIGSFVRNFITKNPDPEGQWHYRLYIKKEDKADSSVDLNTLTKDLQYICRVITY
jgi:hypothetical protein